jgi:hypothetical protein
MLYVLTERWTPALKYRKVFERVKRTVFDFVAEEKCVASAAGEGIIDPATRTALDFIDDDASGGGGGAPGGGGDCLSGVTRMINELTGKATAEAAADSSMATERPSGISTGVRRLPEFYSGADGNLLNVGAAADLTVSEWDFSTVDWSTTFPTINDGERGQSIDWDWESVVFNRL